MYGLTARQREVLGTIASFWREHGYPPTRRQLGDLLAIGSTQGVHDHLYALTRKGVIALTDLDSRAIKITAKGWSELGVTGCPLCGSCRERVA